ncbi:hypothetical protein OIU85_015788 [Salix viminalis]|uniref:Uncharacterized protein n=1 Tax=Salix viminalis TaxID=40686 RepID=A0A9Q0V5N8_SALVM|nr:hypothetical protein OIU85_015788 [Salix viminalis]
MFLSTSWFNDNNHKNQQKAEDVLSNPAEMKFMTASRRNSVEELVESPDWWKNITESLPTKRDSFSKRLQKASAPPVPSPPRQNDSHYLSYMSCKSITCFVFEAFSRNGINLLEISTLSIMKFPCDFVLNANFSTARDE